MAPTSALAEFCRHLLRRPHEGDGSNNPESIGSEELKFSPAPGSSTFEAQPPKKQKGKKVAKAKEINQLETKVSPTSKAKSGLNVLDKSFPYLQFMDKELMTLAYFEQLQGDKNGLVEKF